MSRFQYTLAGAAALVLLAVGAPRALAFAAQGAAASSSTHAVSQATVNLSPIVVYGHHVPLPVALQMVKKALKRPWSSSPEDADKMVCEFDSITGSHFQTLFCQTNRQYFKQQDQTQLAFLTGHNLPVTVVDWTHQSIINRGALIELLKKLPSANASYTLRVTDHGKVVAEYVFKNGNLVGVRKIKPKQ
ncbi:MAG: hypothetical protein ACRESG_08540 [Gammaproteobacteria bacterium]